MPHRKKPRNSGVFWRSRGQATRFALMLQRPSRRDVFWENAKDIACGKSSILGSEPAWLTNSESGQKKNKIFFEKGHDENHGPFSFSRERFRRYAECQSLQKARQTVPTRVLCNRFPASSGTHQRQKPSSGTWRKSSVRRGNPMTENQNNRIPGCRVMSKEGFWNLIAEVNAACGQDQDKYMDMLTNMPRTSTTPSTHTRT